MQSLIVARKKDGLEASIVPVAKVNLDQTFF